MFLTHPREVQTHYCSHCYSYYLRYHYSYLHCYYCYCWCQDCCNQYCSDELVARSTVVMRTTLDHFLHYCTNLHFCYNLHYFLFNQVRSVVVNLLACTRQSAWLDYSYHMA